MKLELVTLTGIVLAEEAYEVMLTTPDGLLGVLPKHMPLVTQVLPGVVSVRRHKDDPERDLEHYAVGAGLIEITGDLVRILVDAAEHSEGIVEQEAREALERAKAAKSEAHDQVELDKAQALIDRQAVRLKVAELRRHHRNLR